MDEFINNFNKLLQKIKVIIYRLHNNLKFLFNKQLTLKKIYEPMLKEKSKENEDLKLTLDSLKLQNRYFEIEKQKILKENVKLKKNIIIFKDLLVKK